MSENEKAAESEAKSSCFCHGHGPEWTAKMRSIDPDNAWRHFRAARIEFLKGLRDLIDARIEQLSRAADPPKGAKVTVE